MSKSFIQNGGEHFTFARCPFTLPLTCPYFNRFLCSSIQHSINISMQAELRDFLITFSVVLLFVILLFYFGRRYKFATRPSVSNIREQQRSAVFTPDGNSADSNGSYSANVWRWSRSSPMLPMASSNTGLNVSGAHPRRYNIWNKRNKHGADVTVINTDTPTSHVDGFEEVNLQVTDAASYRQQRRRSNSSPHIAIPMFPPPSTPMSPPNSVESRPGSKHGRFISESWLTTLTSRRPNTSGTFSSRRPNTSGTLSSRRPNTSASRRTGTYEDSPVLGQFSSFDTTTPEPRTKKERKSRLRTADEEQRRQSGRWSGIFSAVSFVLPHSTPPSHSQDLALSPQQTSVSMSPLGDDIGHLSPRSSNRSTPSSSIGETPEISPITDAFPLPSIKSTRSDELLQNKKSTHYLGLGIQSSNNISSSASSPADSDSRSIQFSTQTMERERGISQSSYDTDSPSTFSSVGNDDTPYPTSTRSNQNQAYNRNNANHYQKEFYAI